MAGEITLTGTLTVAPEDTEPFSRILSVVEDMAGENYVRNKMSIAAGNITGNISTAIDLASVATPHWGWFKNLDPTNYVVLRNGVDGENFARLYPGVECVIPLDPACVPYAVSDTGAILLDYMIAAQ